MHEIWKPVEQTDGIYEVSNQGRIRRVNTGQVIAQRKGKNGYARVHLSIKGKSKHMSVHRLVATAFCEKRDGCDIVNHIDNDRKNNKASNLEWTTSKGNMQHAAKQGRMKYKPENLARAQAAIRKPVVAISKNGDRRIFESGAEAARALGLQRGHIAACCRQEYGYKTVGGYRFEYADKELQSQQAPKKVGMSKKEFSDQTRKRMLGNTYMQGRHLKDETKQKLSVANGRKVQQVDKVTGAVIATFQSANYAKKETGINHISSCANGTRKTAGGYYWRYIE